MRPPSCAVIAWLAALVLLVSRPAAAAPERTAVKVIVPEAGNLQLVAFYVAVGAGFFSDEGIDVEPVSPASPALAQGTFTNGGAPAALLPAPVYERLIEERFPFVLEANLLASDPIDLVVPRAIAEAHGLTGQLPLVDRLRAMKGMRIGVGPHPRPRLVALFASQGLDVDAIAQVVVVPGKQQNEALAAGDVDALYTHTPFLENAILDEGAVIVVNQSGGEVPALTDRQIHVLGVTRAFAESQPAAVRGLVSGIARAERLVHEDPRAATNAVLRALPARDRAHVERILSIYAPAVPTTPRVTVPGITKEISFYPDGAAPPSFAGIDLERFVASEVAESAPARITSRRTIAAFTALALLLALLIVLSEARDRSRNGRGDTSV